MRSHQLLGRRVVGPDGRDVGEVVDLRLRVGGASGGPLPALVVDGLVVSRRRLGILWGYERREQQGPWLLRTLLRRWHRGASYAPWTDVTVPAADGAPVVLLRAAGPLPPLP